MVKWATSTKLAVNWLNRAQNISILTLCEATTGVCTKKHEDESEGWLHRQNEAPLFSKDGLKLFFTRPIPQGGRGKFFHISMAISQSTLNPSRVELYRRMEQLPYPAVELIEQGLLLSRFGAILLVKDLDCRLAISVPGSFSYVAMMLGLLQNVPNTSSDTLLSITSGDWDVTQVLAYNEESQLMVLNENTLTVGLYITETHQHQALRLEPRPYAEPRAVDHLSPSVSVSFCADTVGPFNRRCLSCDFSDSCGYVSGSFSHDMAYFLLSCKGPGVPFVAIYSTQSRQKLLDIELNLNLRQIVDSMQMPRVEYREIDIDDYTLTMQILKPAGFIDTAHYPLLLLVDGTPGGQLISEQFQVDWATVLVSSFGVITMRFDGRGSGFQGTNLLHKVQRRLGRFEEEDQLKALSVLLKEPYIDKTRIGAFGQVYGGYITSLLLSSEDSVLKCGAVLSPITDFELYGKLCGERGWSWEESVELDGRGGAKQIG
ncbi:hypothetical protein NFI96_002386 [Prochilodus magdalenae]|nr:hypothetical protein NFI96_002386 [Prochilodus magdalenae]